MRELWKSIKRGTPMTRRFLWRSLEVVGISSLVALTISAPFIASTIENPVYKGLVWTLFVILIMIFAVAVGLMPYWGMRELKKETENRLIEKNMAYEHTKPLRELETHQKDNPQDYIFPYIERIDATQIQNGKDYLTLNYYIPSALLYDLNFVTAKCCLVINLETTDEKDISVLTIKKVHNNRDYKEINLGQRISQQTREKLKNRISMKFKLEFKCWDDNAKEFRFTTEEREMIALV